MLFRSPQDADLSAIAEDLRDKAVPVSALSKHPDNPQIHPEANKKAIAGSLKRYLQRKPIVVNLTASGLRIEAGHGVYEQMVQAGSDYVAVTIVEDDPVTEFGYMIADNRTSELSETDPERLAPILRQLIDAGEDVEEIGWDDAALAMLLGEPDSSSGGGGKDEDETEAPVDRAAELQQEWQTALGQIWEIPSKSEIGRAHV